MRLTSLASAVWNQSIFFLLQCIVSTCSSCFSGFWWSWLQVGHYHQTLKWRASLRTSTGRWKNTTATWKRMWDTSRSGVHTTLSLNKCACSPIWNSLMSLAHTCFCCRRIWKVCRLSRAKRRLLTWTRYNSNHMSLFNSRRRIKNPNPDKMYQNNCCYYTIITHTFTLSVGMLCEIQSSFYLLVLVLVRAPRWPTDSLSMSNAQRSLKISFLTSDTKSSHTTTSCCNTWWVSACSLADSNKYKAQKRRKIKTDW